MNNLGEQVSSTQCSAALGYVRESLSVLYISGIAGDWNGTLQLFHIEPRLRLPVFSTTGCTPYNTLFWGGQAIAVALVAARQANFITAALCCFSYSDCRRARPAGAVPDDSVRLVWMES